MSDRIYEFVQLDVFTQTPLTGNPLAIFTDARGLNDGEMQALARESADSTGGRDSASQRNVCASNARRPTCHERSCWRIRGGSAARNRDYLASDE